MARPDLQSLLGTVRRHLWRCRFVAAARLAMWGTAGLSLLAVAVHLVAHAVPAGAVLVALAALWLAMLGWAASRRPAVAASALWADRHLDGASAFTTWLEVARGGQEATNTQVAQWLDAWATARVPDSLRLLRGRREPDRLARPLLAMLVCAALLVVVLALPGQAAGPRPAGAGAPLSAVADRPPALADAPGAARLVDEVSSALRSAQSAAASGRREAAGAGAAGAGQAADGASTPPARADATSAGEQSAEAPPRPGAAAVATAPQGARTQAGGTGSGRDAGDTADNRVDVGAMRMRPEAMAVQRSASALRPPTSERRADADQLGNYDDSMAMQRAMVSGAGPAPLAATPPAASQDSGLTPTEMNYVQAWLKASAQRR
jgi:hypothetical protein